MTTTTEVAQPAPLLDIDDLSVTFSTRRGFRRGPDINAVDHATLSVLPGETVGIVGESGSGKSTLGRTVLGLQPIAGGHVRFAGRDVPQRRRPSREHLRDVQAVFQNPLASLNPTIDVGGVLAEPLRYLCDITSNDEREERVIDLLKSVGLPPEARFRHRNELSGGQRQRVAIARALAPQPRLIVCDEAVSALDVSTQAQIVNLLMGLRAEREVAYLFIAHDLTVVRNISHRVGVMYHGQLVEWGDAITVHDRPAHPYTQSLLAAAPVPDPVRQRQRRGLRKRTNEAKDSSLPGTTGCVFAARCPHVEPRCVIERPLLRQIGDRSVACHFAESTAAEWIVEELVR